MADIADSTGAINGSWALSRPPSLASQPAAAAAADGDTSGPSPREHAHRLPRNGQGFFLSTLGPSMLRHTAPASPESPRGGPEVAKSSLEQAYTGPGQAQTGPKQTQ